MLRKRRRGEKERYQMLSEQKVSILVKTGLRMRGRRRRSRRRWKEGVEKEKGRKRRGGAGRY